MKNKTYNWNHWEKSCFEPRSMTLLQKTGTTCIFSHQPFFRRENKCPCVLYGPTNSVTRLVQMVEKHARGLSLSEPDCKTFTHWKAGTIYPVLGLLPPESPLKKLFLLSVKMSITSTLVHCAIVMHQKTNQMTTRVTWVNWMMVMAFLMHHLRPRLIVHRLTCTNKKQCTNFRASTWALTNFFNTSLLKA